MSTGDVIPTMALNAFINLAPLLPEAVAPSSCQAVLEAVMLRALRARTALPRLADQAMQVSSEEEGCCCC